MITHLTALALSEPGAVGFRLIHGQFPDAIDIATLASGVGDKPSLKKVGEDLLVIIPQDGGNGKSGWCAWLFDVVPPVADLPSLIDLLTNLGNGLFANGSGERSSSPQAGGLPALSDKAEAAFLQVLKDVCGVGTLSRQRFMQRFVESVSQNDLSNAVALVYCNERKSGSVVLSDQTLIGYSDELALLVDTYRADKPVEELVLADDKASDRLDAAILAESLSAENLLFHVPALGQSGVAIIFIDASKPEKGLLTPLANLASMGLHQKLTGQQKQQFKRIWQGVGAAALVALVAYLMMPTDLMVTASALSLPQTARTVNLPFDSYLQDMKVDVGDKVERGDLLSSMSSPSLEARQSEVALQISVQEMSGKAALAKNDYGSYQLAMKKIETQQAELEQIERKLEQLTVRAPVSGTVIRTMGRESLGRFVTTGDPLAIIQPDDRFSISLTLSDVDAPLVQPGQKGSVFFRGLSDQSYHFTMQTPVYVEKNPQSQTERLVAKATIDQPGKGRLISGLTGFARVKAGRSLRIVVLTRYVTEFIRIKAWTYLGLHF